MTDVQLHQLLTDADPMPAARAASLPVDDAQQALLAALVEEDRAPAPSRTRVRRRLVPRFGLALGATAAALIAVFTIGHGGHGSASAWGAEQVRFAQASPLVLLEAPGWRVEYADEESTTDGELHFRTGPTPPPQTTAVNAAATAEPVPADTTFAQLNWRSGDLDGWIKDRAYDAAVATTAPVLGTTAHVYQYQGGTPGHRDITALWRYDDRVLEFRAGAADVDAFKALLATLTRVDTDTWLSAMPGSAVKPADHGTTIQAMLKGIPLPPGFDAKSIKGADLTKDHYQLGAAVSGTVACEWFATWAAARKANDTATERRAVAAMATAKDWPILADMEQDGAYPQVLRGYAAAMRTGLWYGRPLLGDVDSGLGCSDLGVPLG